MAPGGTRKLIRRRVATLCAFAVLATALPLAAQSSPFTPVPVRPTETPDSAHEEEADEEEDDDEEAHNEAAQDDRDSGQAAPTPWGEAPATDPVLEPAVPDNSWGSGTIEDPENSWGSGAIEDPENSWGSGAIEDPENSWGSGAIEDPENSWGSGAIEDPQNGWGSGAIEDPENGWGSGAIEDPQNGWGSGAIEDSQNTGTIADPQNRQPAPTPTPAPSVSRGRPSAIFSGAFRSSASVDMVRDDQFEDTIELLQELEARVRYRLNDRWRFVLEGRLGWLMTGASAEGTTTLIPESDSIEGRVRPELRDFYVAGRAGNWLLRLGNQSIVWGSTDISKPADIINPLNLEAGLTGERDDMRIPVPALDFTRVWDDVAWEFVVVPFFRAHAVAVVGGDIAPIRSAGVNLSLFPGAEELVLIDRSLEDLAQPLLLQTELPEERPQNASVGSRLTLIKRGWDVSAGYLYGWDRTPFIEFSPAAITLFNSAITGQSDLTIDSPEVQAVLQSLAEGETLYSATYERMHTVEVDGVTYVGPVGVRFEAAMSPRRTLFLETLESVRRPMLTSALGLSYEASDGELVLAAEVFHNYAALRSADADGLYGLDNLLGFGTGAQLGLARYEKFDDRFASRLRFQLGGFYLPDGRDLIVSFSTICEINDQLELTLAATVAESLGSATSLGDLIDQTDSIRLQIQRVF